MAKLHGAALKAHLKRLGRKAGRSRTTMKNGRPHRKKSFTIPVAIVAGIAPGAIMTYNSIKSFGAQGGITTFGRIYTGYDNEQGKFNMASMRYGTFPLILGFVVHRLAGALGINQALARAGIPIIRL